MIASIARVNTKIALQKLYAKWTTEKVESKKFNKPLFLGGSQKEGDTVCYSLINGIATADFHANHLIKVERYYSVVIASPDTDAFRGVVVCVRSK